MKYRYQALPDQIISITDHKAFRTELRNKISTGIMSAAFIEFMDVQYNQINDQKNMNIVRYTGPYNGL